MATEFRRVTVPISGGSGRKTLPGVAVFSSTVLQAGVALNGFRFTFDTNDRRVDVIEADVDLVNTNLNTVNFNVQCRIADDSNNDSYSGYISALVAAEVA